MKRTPVRRKAIKLGTVMKAHYKLEHLLDSTVEDDVWDIIYKYEEMFRDRSALPYYIAVTRDVKKYPDDKKFHQFQKVYYICRIKKWDAMKYIEMQFDRFKNMNSKIKLPPVNALASDGAIKYCMREVGRIRLSYERDMHVSKRLVGDNSRGNFVSAMELNILQSVIDIDKVLKKSKAKDKSVQKTLELYNNWKNYSAEYLYAVPWLRGEIRKMTSDPLAIQYSGIFDAINEDPYLREHNRECCEQIEQHYRIPPTKEL